MQERFCSCGNKVMVHYGVVKTSWKPVFSVADGQASFIRVCPCCGKPLDIDSLR